MRQNPRTIYFPDSDDRVQLYVTPAGVHVARLYQEDGELSHEHGTGGSLLEAVADLVEALAGAEG